MTQEQYREYNRRLLEAVAAVCCYQSVYSFLHYSQATEAIAGALSYALLATRDALSDEVKIILNLRDVLTAAKRQHEETERMTAAAR